MSQVKVKIERESPGPDEIEFGEYQQQEDFNLKFEPPEEDENTIQIRVLSDFFLDEASDPEDFPQEETSGDDDDNKNKKGGRGRKTKSKSTSSRTRKKPRQSGEPARRKKTPKSGSASRSRSSKDSKSTPKKARKEKDVDAAGEKKKSAPRKGKRLSEMTEEEQEKFRERWKVDKIRKKLRARGLPPMKLEDIREMIKSNAPLPPPPKKPSISKVTSRTGYTQTGPPGERRRKRLSEMTPEERVRVREKWRQQYEQRRLRMQAQGVDSASNESLTHAEGSNPPAPPPQTQKKPSSIILTSEPSSRPGYTRTGPPGDRRRKRLSEMTPEERVKVRAHWRQQQEQRRLRMQAQGVDSASNESLTYEEGSNPPAPPPSPPPQTQKKPSSIILTSEPSSRPGYTRTGPPGERRRKRLSEMTPEERVKVREQWRQQQEQRRLRMQAQGVDSASNESWTREKGSNPPAPPPSPPPQTQKNPSSIILTSEPSSRPGYTRTGPPGQRRKKRLSEMTPEEQEKVREQWRQQNERRHLRRQGQEVKRKPLTPEQRARRNQRQSTRTREKYRKMTPEERAEYNQRRTLRELEKIANMTEEEKEIYDFKKLCRLEYLKKKRLERKEIPVVETEEEREKRRESYRRYYHTKVKANPVRKRKLAELRKIYNRRYKEERAQREGRVYIPRFRSDQGQGKPKRPRPRPRPKPGEEKTKRTKMAPEERLVRRREMQRKRRAERNKKLMEHVASGMTMDEAYAQFETPEKRVERLLQERIKFAQRMARIGLRESGTPQEVIDKKMEEIEETLRMKPGRRFQPYKMRTYKRTKSEPETDLQLQQPENHDDDFQLETRAATSSASVTFDTGGHEDGDGDHDEYRAAIHGQSQSYAPVHSFMIPATGASGNQNQNFEHLQRPEPEDDLNHDDDDDDSNDQIFRGDDDDFQNSPCPSPDSSNLQFTVPEIKVIATSTISAPPPPPPENPSQSQPCQANVIVEVHSWGQGQRGGEMQPILPPQPKRGRGRPKTGEVVISLEKQRLMRRNDPEQREANKLRFKRTGARLDPGETLESAHVVVCDLCGLMYRRKTFLQHRVIHHNPYFEPGRICKLCDKKIKVKRQYEMYNHFRLEHPAEFKEIRAPLAHIIGNHGVTQFKPKENNVTISELDHLCEECGRGFSNARLLYEHTYRHHGPEKPKEEDRPVCDLCPEHRRRPFTLRSSYLDHLKKKHPGAVGQRKRIKICGPCGQSFPTRDMLLAHLEANHPGKSHPCTFCPMVFFTRAGAIYHLQRCSKKPTRAQRNEIETNAENEPEETRPLILRKLGVHCEFCGSHQVLKGLIIHYLESHGIKEDKGFQCWRCEKKYNVRDSLMVHLYDFHGEEWDDEFKERIHKVNLSEEKRANLVVKNPEGKINGYRDRTIRKIKYREKRLKELGMEVTQENLERMKWGKKDGTKTAGSGTRPRGRPKSSSSSRRNSKKSWSESGSEDEEDHQDDASESEAESWKSSGSEVDFQGDVDEDCGNRRRSSRIVQKKKKAALKKSVRKRSGGFKRNVGLKQEVQVDNYVEVKKKLVVAVTKLSAEEITKYTKKSDASDQ